MTVGPALVRLTSREEFCLCGLSLGVGQRHRSMHFMPPALVEFHGIPESVLASGKFVSRNEG